MIDFDKNFVCWVMDFDHEVIDICMNVANERIWIQGFDDTDWKEADAFATKIADSLGIEYVGEVMYEDWTEKCEA